VGFVKIKSSKQEAQSR